jgi:GYF domain 2
MEIYIQKNHEQLGPFDQAKVLAMLEGGELSPQDLVLLKGQTQWQTLGSILSKKSTPQNLKMPPGLVVMLGILLTLFTSGMFGMMYISNQHRQAKIAETDRQIEQERNASLAAAENAKKQAAHYKAFADEAIKVARLKPAFKLDENAKIKGKSLIFIKTQEAFSDYTMVGFDNRSNENLQQYISQDESAVKDYGMTFPDLAENLDELATVIQIDCRNGDVVANYEGGIPAYANRCSVSVIDYKTKTIVAQETFENSTPEDSIRARKDQFSEVLMYPFEKIQNYVKEFPRSTV